MNQSKKNITVTNPWTDLRSYTPARLALGRTGHSVPTQAHLDFRAAHARARDAIHQNVDFKSIRKSLEQRFQNSHTIQGNPLPIMLEVSSSATDRWTYLKRPDLGRSLSLESQQRISLMKANSSNISDQSIAIVLADGLSATAINLHGANLLSLLLQDLVSTQIYTQSILFAHQARVAIGDEIGELLGVSAVVVLIGERPGLSNVEGIGAYITFNPLRGKTDSERNCVSNICPQGLNLEEASHQITQLIRYAFHYKSSGVTLSTQLADHSQLIHEESN